MFFDKFKIHDIEKEQFKNIFRQCGFGDFEERYSILDIFLKIEKHLTSDELAGLLEIDGIKLSNSFVKETLDLMCNLGFAQKRVFDTGVELYEHLHIGTHHDHIICTICGKITEFENRDIERLQVQIAKSKGFHMLNHRMDLYGICNLCLNKRLPYFVLSNAREGERLVIDNLTGCKNSRTRLLNIGLKPGDNIEVITHYSSGPMIIAREGKRYIIGKGLSEKIRCRPYYDVNEMESQNK